MNQEIAKKIYIAFSFIILLNFLEINQNRTLFNQFITNIKILLNKTDYTKKIIVGISYSNSIYQTQLKLCKKSALEIGKVDIFYDYGPQDIKIDFKQSNINILSYQRGNGYWLWKPYFILKTLKEKLKDGDYLIYTDATVLYKDNVKILIDFLQKKDEDMWFYKLTSLEKYYSKRDAFILMGADNKYYSETFQYNAALQIYKKTGFSIKFVEDYIYYGKDKRIITDQPNTLSFPNYEGFKDHRHDQTILSLLIKKYNKANSGKTNINITVINNIQSEMPFIFCHYRRIKFKDYE